MHFERRGKLREGVAVINMQGKLEEDFFFLREAALEFDICFTKRFPNAAQFFFHTVHIYYAHFMDKLTDSESEQQIECHLQVYE